MKLLTRGFRMNIVSEIVYGSIFYSCFESNVSQNTFVKSIIGASMATCMTHPLNLRCKLRQLNKTNTIKKMRDNYKGLSYALCKTVPGISLTYSLRDISHNILPPELKPIGSICSSLTSIILTHPLDTLYSAKCTNVKINIKDTYRGIKETLLEKNCNVTGKIILLDTLNNVNKFKNNSNE